MLLCSTTFTVVVVAFLTMFKAKLPDLHIGPNLQQPWHNNPNQTLSCINGDVLESPFKNTMAMIRWNSMHPERVPLLMKYEPFFHTVHISLPGYFPDKPTNFHNLTHDQWPENGTFTVYKQIARTMRLILEEEPKINGLLYFHFDAWINPLAWAGADANTIWFPSILDVRPPSGGGPEFHCMTNPQVYGWWGWDQGFHKAVMAAQEVIQRMGLPFVVNPKEWCSGWSDIYYVPRRFFADYILLSEVMGQFQAFHETAVPTMMHIIDQSRRSNKYRSAMDLIGDCWGSCCASNPNEYDVLSSRCGHRIDYRNEKVSMTFFDHLDEEARSLGQPANCSVSTADSPMFNTTVDVGRMLREVAQVKAQFQEAQRKEDEERKKKEEQEKKEKEEKEKKEKEEQENRPKEEEKGKTENEEQEKKTKEEDKAPKEGEKTEG